jgi:AbrB family looped-hinge helix DNA binding protein
MRVTSKGQVTIPLRVRKALGIKPGSEVDFELGPDGAYRLVRDRADIEAQIDRMMGTADTGLTTDEILALTRG